MSATGREQTSPKGQVADLARRLPNVALSADCQCPLMALSRRPDDSRAEQPLRVEADVDVRLLSIRERASTMEADYAMEPDYRRLKAVWQSGHRDREDALQLLFLAWQHWADPNYPTGLEEELEAIDLWLVIFGYFGGEHSQDAEFLHVAALMADIDSSPFISFFGDSDEWYDRAERMEARSIQLQPEGFPPEQFEGRGDYGEYFAHHARAQRAPPMAGDLRPCGLRGWIVKAAQRFFSWGGSRTHQGRKQR